MARWTYRIEASMPAGRAVAILLETLLGAMEACEQGVVERRGDEPLHDFRVAVRRSRSALSLFGGVLPGAVTRRGKGLFKDLGRRTANARDLDVLLLELPGYAEELAAAGREGLAELELRIDRRRVREYSAIRRWLEGATYGRRVRSWREVLQKLAAADAGEGESIRHCAADAIRKAASGARGLAQAIRERDPEGDAVHRLRIRFKKLRYVLEFSSALTPGGEADQAIERLKALQDQLGTHQDLVVHERRLAATASAPERDQAADSLARSLVGVVSKRRRLLRRSIDAHAAAIQEELESELDGVVAAITGG